MKKYILIFALLCAACNNGWAACGGSVTESPVGTFAAYDATYDCVSDAITAATAAGSANSGYGNTVTIPACAAGDCVWTSSITITKDIILRGAGMNSTYIRNNITPTTGIYSGIFHFNPSSDATTIGRLDGVGEDSGVFEVSNLTFDSSSVVAYRCGIKIMNSSATQVKRIKIHDNRFTIMSMSVMTDGSNTSGVIYNNVFLDARGPKFGGPGRSGYSNLMVPGDGNGWYVEDNNYSLTGTVLCSPFMASNANNGGGYVLRYNTASGTLKSGDSVTATETHGNQNSDIWGAQKTEVYGNSINVSQYYELHHVRGGKNVIFYNKHRNDDVRDIAFLEEYSDFATTTGGYLANICAEVDGVQVCASDCVCQKVHDSYVWTNQKYSDSTWIGVGIDQDDECYQYGASSWCTTNYPVSGEYPIHSTPREVTLNREVYVDSRATVSDVGGSVIQSAGTFNGTSGMGCGTLATLQGAAYYTSCTAGVGYWATDQSCSDMTGMVGANPATPISGTLYKCNATGDGWDSYYTPYEYPHPLRTDGGGEDPETSYTVTVSHTGTGVSMSHDGASTVLSGGTINIIANLYNGHRGTWSTTDADACSVSSCPTTEGAVNTCSITTTGTCTVTFTATEIKLLN